MLDAADVLARIFTTMTCLLMKSMNWRECEKYVQLLFFIALLITWGAPGRPRNLAQCHATHNGTLHGEPSMALIMAFTSFLFHCRSQRCSSDEHRRAHQCDLPFDHGHRVRAQCALMQKACWPQRNETEFLPFCHSAVTRDCPSVTKVVPNNISHPFGCI